MRPSPLQDLRLLWTGLSRLLERPLVFAGLSLMAVALTALGPLVRTRVVLPEDPMVDWLLRGAALLPMELYALPRLQAWLDARTLDTDRNPAGTWAKTFEARWGRATGSRLLLSLMAGLGLALCLVPGLLVLLAFGWGPTRTLLRGDGIREGYRASARMMARGWPRAVVVVGLCVILQSLVSWPLAALAPDPGHPFLSLRSPWFWAEAAASGVLGVWFASTLLALFQALEADQAPSPEASSSSDEK
ncbi:MAG: hypothetical protein U0P81_01610 [Holophagaceae bacterium]